MNKRRLLIFASALFCVLFLIAAAVTLYAVSPLHPENITDKAVIQKGTEYTVRLTGVSDYDEKGFVPVAEGFYLSEKRTYIYTDEKGFAHAAFEGDGQYVLGKYSSFFVDYEKYNFCGSYKSRQELQKFFEEPDYIYNFDINNLSQYVQDVLQFKKHLNGKATVKIYRGRFVITQVFIGDEKIMEIK